MKKPRRKHNIKKRRETYSRIILRQLNAAVVWVRGANDNACGLIDLKTCQLMSIRPEIQYAITEIAHDWVVYCAAFGRKQDGQEYMKSSMLRADRCFQHQIADQVNNEHQKIIAGMNQNHKIGAGWIACPYDIDLTETMAAEVFDKLGAWS